MCIRNGALAIISRSKNIKWFFKSLKFRFFLLFFLVGTLPCLIVQTGILHNYEDSTVSARMMEARTQCDMIANRIGNSGYLEDPSSAVINAQISQLANVYDGRILVIDQYFRIVQDTYFMSTGKTMVSEEVLQCFKNGSGYHYNKEDSYLELTVPIKQRMSEDAKGASTTGVLLISVSMDSLQDSLDGLQQKIIVLELVATILLAVAAVFLSLWLVKPFDRITEEIGEHFDGYGKEEIQISNYSETQEISEAFNKTISRMKVIDDSRQEFVSNVSHELKTPIASMKVLADSLLMQENVPVEIYEEFMQDITAEIDRESKIIDDLLSLVKMDKTASDLNIVPVNINELLELILKRLAPIAKKRGIELSLVCERQVVADADEVKLTLALSNFVENAIKYNRDNGWVNVSLDADHKVFTVVVEDSGIGIPKEDFEHIFERFYRVDKSHSREIGGTGLGLAIARSAILMHRGAVEVESKVGEGTRFTIRIPLIYILSGG